MLISKGAARSVTDVSPIASRARMARRVGSASAANVELIWSSIRYSTSLLNNHSVKYKICKAQKPKYFYFFIVRRG
jgi:hypothetical protein